jgi:hypothetical protein
VAEILENAVGQFCPNLWKSLGRADDRLKASHGSSVVEFSVLVTHSVGDRIHPVIRFYS